MQGIFDHRSRGSGQGRSPETSQPAGMPVLSRTEYWSFLGVAVLLTLFVAAPQKWKETVPGQASTGAFGTKRSSDEARFVQYSRARQAGHGRSAMSYAGDWVTRSIRRRDEPAFQ